MAVITISRQLGSHGARISRSLAKELGYTFADKSVIDRVIRQYGLTRLEQLYNRPPSIWELFNENSMLTIEMMNDTIAALAKRGNVVILGRGGFKVLHGMKDVLNVFVTAPMDIRVKRIAGRDGIAEDAAAAKIKEDDAMRAKFTRLFYDADWADPKFFDLVVDTGALTDAEGRDTIEAALLEMKPAAPGDRVAAALEIDPVLAKTVEDVLAW